MRPLSPILRHLGACPEALAWLAREQHPTFIQAWNACPRGSWLLWLAAVVGYSREARYAAYDELFLLPLHGTGEDIADIVRRHVDGREVERLLAAIEVPS